MADKAERKQYRVKDGGPDHYVNGQGTIKAGGTFWYAGPALSKWCEEVKPGKKEKPATEPEVDTPVVPAADTGGF